MNNNGFAKESTDIVNSVTGVILADKTKYSFRKHPVVGQNMIILLEDSFNRIEQGKTGYMSGLVEIGGKDYITLNYAGTDALIDLGLPRKKLDSIDRIVKENDVGQGMGVVSKNHSVVPYALNNIAPSIGVMNNDRLSDSEVFGPRKEVKCTVDGHNYVTPHIDTYDLVMSHFTNN